MAHVGQKLTLGFIRLFGRYLGLPKLLHVGFLGFIESPHGIGSDHQDARPDSNVIPATLNEHVCRPVDEQICVAISEEPHQKDTGKGG